MDDLNDLSLILTDLQVIALELQKQGFLVEPDEDAAGRQWLMVFSASGVHLIATFTPDATDWRRRANALARCKAAGFRWPP
jgi:hypothetical protein